MQLWLFAVAVEVSVCNRGGCGLDREVLANREARGDSDGAAMTVCCGRGGDLSEDSSSYTVAVSGYGLGWWRP